MQAFIEKIPSCEANAFTLTNLRFDHPDQPAALSNALNQNKRIQVLILEALNAESCSMMSKCMAQNNSIGMLVFDRFNPGDGNPACIIPASTHITAIDLSAVCHEFMPAIMSAIAKTANISSLHVDLLNREALTTCLNHLDSCDNISHLVLGEFDFTMTNILIDQFNKRATPIELTFKRQIPSEIISKILSGIVNKKVNFSGLTAEANTLILAQNSQSFHCLDTLTFDNVEQRSAFSTTLIKNTSVEQLILKKINPEICNILAESIRQNKNIELLLFDNFSEGNGDPSFIIKQAPNQVVAISLSEISNKFMPTIMPAIATKTHIFGVYFQNLNSDSLTTLLDYLDKCTNICQLGLIQLDPNMANILIDHLNKRTKPITLLIDEIPLEIIDKILNEIVNKNISFEGNEPKIHDYILNRLQALKPKQEIFLRPTSNRSQNSNNKKRKIESKTPETNDVIKIQKIETLNLYNIIAKAVLETENQFLKNHNAWHQASNTQTQQLIFQLSTKMPKKVAGSFKSAAPKVIHSIPQPSINTIAIPTSPSNQSNGLQETSASKTKHLQPQTVNNSSAGINPARQEAASKSPTNFAPASTALFSTTQQTEELPAAQSGSNARTLK